MQFEMLKQVVEVLIFASDIPLSDKQIRGFIQENTISEIRKAIDTLNLDYKHSNRAFYIIKVAGGYQMVTRESFAQWIRKIFQKRSTSRLSQAALETLSIVAFKQPVPRSEISIIRGVNCDGVLHTLLDRKLITIAGRSDGPGRPLLYRTTKEFLRYFGVNDVSDLPKPKEIEEMLKESEDQLLPEMSTDDFNKQEMTEKPKNAIE